MATAASDFKYDWVSGLNENAFIEQIKVRRLPFKEIMIILSHYISVGRSATFFEFITTLNVTVNDVYIYLRQVDVKLFLESFLAYAKKASLPPSMLAWLIKEKNLVNNKELLDLFRKSSPSPMDYCWIFSEFPALKTKEFLADFMLSHPNQHHIDYLVNVLRLDVEWLSDSDEVEKVIRFMSSV